MKPYTADLAHSSTDTPPAIPESVAKPVRVPPAKETDPTGRRPQTPGAKLDAGKVPVMRGAIQYFPRAMRAVAAISAFGATKYTWGGWESVPDGIQRYTDALGRHLIDEACGELVDAESGMLHAAHAAWNALARLELLVRQVESELACADVGG